MGFKLEQATRSILQELLQKVEEKLGSDVFTYYGDIVDGVECQVKDLIA